MQLNWLTDTFSIWSRSVLIWGFCWISCLLLNERCSKDSCTASKGIFQVWNWQRIPRILLIEHRINGVSAGKPIDSTPSQKIHFKLMKLMFLLQTRSFPSIKVIFAAYVDSLLTEGIVVYYNDETPCRVCGVI